ncbi:hypothetical protein K0M31_003045 [Melipona bicolor]|uniref:Uncharacterized protein n=1 Tax=Melipona bicolor TaxID=60889 RepID=A0AA40G0A7_9HYME|nr:hypothetical protein K0M31_003045 [Melipona bicolor]
MVSLPNEPERLEGITDNWSKFIVARNRGEQILKLNPLPLIISSALYPMLTTEARQGDYAEVASTMFGISNYRREGCTLAEVDDEVGVSFKVSETRQNSSSSSSKFLARTNGVPCHRNFDQRWNNKKCFITMPGI